MKTLLKAVQRQFIPTVAVALVATPPPDDHSDLACLIFGLIGGALFMSIMYDYAESWDNRQEPETDTESDEEFF